MNTILDRIKRGTSDLPPRILIAGTEGIGKSTFASKAPDPLFIAPEDGLTGLDHVRRFMPTSLDDLHALLDALLIDTAGPKTVVIDTIDWLERLITQSICERDKKSDIEEYGYGKGYVILENELVKILKKLDDLRQKRKACIILLSHVQIRIFNDPRGQSYDRFEMKGHKKFTGILREWTDASLFAVYEVSKVKVRGQQKDVAVGGDRVMHTQWSPAWDAKNRLNLPEVLPLEWEAFENAVNENSVISLAQRVRAAYAEANGKIPSAERVKWEKALDSLDSMTADRLQNAITKLQTFK